MAELAGAFDPYHKWLGIPPRDQPPHHYRLLGLEIFESDEEVIEAAARRLIAFCEQNAHGPNAAAARRVEFEIAAARLCLLDPEKRAAYDIELKSRKAPAVRGSAGVTRKPASRPDGNVDRRAAPLPRPAAPAATISAPPQVVPPPVPPSDPFDFESGISSLSRVGKHTKGLKPPHASIGSHNKRGKKNKNSLLIVGGMALLAVLLMVICAMIFLVGEDTVAEDTEKRQESSDVPPPAEENDANTTEEETVKKPTVEVASVAPTNALTIAKTAAPTDDGQSTTSNLIDVTESPSQRLLEVCSRGGTEAEVEKLLSAGANLEEADPNGRTPLRLAVMGNDLPLVKALIDAKASLDTQDFTGETPLMSAVRHGNVKLVTLLLEKGADSNLATKGKLDKGGDTTPLHVAARYGKTDVAKLLIDRDAKVDKPNRAGVTPLMVAAWQGHEDTAIALMEQGAEVKTAVDAAGQTPLMYAARGGKLELIKAMLVDGAMVGKKSKAGSTALSIAESSPQRNEQVIARLKQAAGEEAPDLDF